MKRIFTLLALTAFILPLLAQSPDLMSYQAVLRNAENNLITNQAVAVQISILQGTPNGTSVFTEVHTLSTNANGLISLVIGDGVGDDLSTVDWSGGPYFIKTETDPAGGSTYTITSTTQLLSVPYAKYADEAGNAFSGAYGDLSGAPTVVSAFTNDEGYLTAITGTETAFDGWDKDEADLWTQNGSDIYFEGGNVGIGTSTPARAFTVYTGANSNYSAWNNLATGTNVNDGFLVGIDNNLDAYVWNWEAAEMFFGTNNTTRMTISGAGDVGIGTQAPTARLDVRGDTKFGANGIAFNEMREFSGTTFVSGYYTSVTLPTGYTEDNTRVLSIQINYGGDRWTGLGYDATTERSVAYIINESTMYIYYPDQAAFHSSAFRVLLMQIAL